MPSSRTKLKQYGVRVNGMLIRKSFASAAEARKWQAAQKLLQDQIRSGSKKHLSPTLLVVHFADFLRERKNMPSFGQQEAQIGKYVLSRPKFQGKLLHEITKADWREVFGENGELVKEHLLAPATHNHIRATVHKAYEDARRKWEPPRALDNPVHDIPPLKIPKRKPKILASAEDIQAYVKAAYKDPLFKCWGPYVAIKLNTGLRQQNIIPLRWKDLSPDGLTLTIREKHVRSKYFTGFRSGHKSDDEEKSVGVNAALRSALEAWKAITPHSGPEDFIVSLSDGSHITQKRIWDANVRTLKSAGLPYLSEHKLRHSYASHYLAAGGNMHDLKHNLFHSTITTTEIYSHALEGGKAKRASVLQIEAPNQTKTNDKEGDSK